MDSVGVNANRILYRHRPFNERRLLKTIWIIFSVNRQCQRQCQPNSTTTVTSVKEDDVNVVNFSAERQV